MASILDSWKYLMKEVKAPEIFIEAVFYFMIGAALQRRVWVSSTEAPIFPNPYMILVGPAGVGKGIAIGPMLNLLKHHTLNPLGHVEANRDKIDPDLLIALEELKDKMLDSKMRNPDNVEPSLLFPVGADATSFECMVQDAAKSIGRYRCAEACQMAPNKIYTHSSIAYVLPELSSMFHSNSDRIIQFLTAIFDCGDYTYKIKHGGTDRIKRPCISFLAGTTPADIKRLFRQELIDDGFTARFQFIYADKNRFETMGRPELEPEQLAAKALIIEYIKTLSNIFGKAEFAPDAWEYITSYYMDVKKNGRRVNFNTKLDAYYGRLDLHLLKMSTWVHYSRSTDMTITLSDVETAVKWTRANEANMHYALASIGNNPLYGPQKRIVRYLQMRGAGVTLQEIWTELEGDVRKEELEEIMSTLLALGQIGRKLKDDNKTEVYYKI